MARIDDPSRGPPQESDAPRGTTQLTPTAEEMVQATQPVQSASEYARRTEARRMELAANKGRGKPLGGAPPIPAGKLAGLVPSNMPQPDFGEEPAYESQAPMPSRPPPPPPPMIGGVGAGYAVNQAMARGEIERPVTLGAAKKMGAQQAQQAKQGALSPETVELLKMQQQQGTDETAAPAEQPDDSRKQRLAESEKEIAEGNRFDAADLPLELIAQMRNDILFDVKRKKAIEELLEPLDIADLVTKREIQQKVPSVPGRIEYIFKTLNEQEHLFCLQYVYEFPGSSRYVEELLNMCRLVCSFIALNGRMLPDHRKSPGSLQEEVDRALFDKKFKLMTLYPTPVVADVGAHYHWFSERVNGLFDVEKLKNG